MSEFAIVFVGIVTAFGSFVAVGFAYGLLMRAGYDPLGIGGDVHE